MFTLDQYSFTKIYEENKNQIYRIAFSYVRVKEDAENIMQDAFLRFFRNPPQDGKNIFGWLTTVTKNLSLDYLKHKKREQQYLTQLQNENQSNDTSTDVDILEYVNRLDEKYAIVIRLYYYAEVPIETISKSLKISPNAVSKRLERAKKQLKIMLEGVKL